MGLKLYAEEAVRAIASAIRQKFGTSESYRLREMADAIDAFPSSVMLTDLIVHDNGNYQPPDGYTFSKIIVSVPQPAGVALSVLSNGIYRASGDTGFDEVYIDVPDYIGSPFTVTANGVYTAGGTSAYNPVIVSVPSYQMTSGLFSENGFYEAPALTLWQDLDVDVWTGDDVRLVERTISSYSGSVSYIGSHAFRSCGSLSTVLADACLSIGSFAFAYCSSLVTASFPECVTVNQEAFYQCVLLSDLTLPKCEVIGERAFVSCTSIRTLNLPRCTEILSKAFDVFRVGRTPLLSSVSLPKLKKVETLAFRGHYALSELSLPECELIGGGAFCSCVNLKTVYAPKCTYIADCYVEGTGSALSYLFGAFVSCNSLSDIYFPECTYIGSEAFHYLSRLTSLSFPKCKIIREGAFRRCTSLRRIDFPVCTTVYKNAFLNCTSLSVISMPMCETISTYAFASCNALSGRLDLPACKRIDSRAFMRSSSGGLTELSLPACETIEDRAFDGQAFTDVYLPAVVSMTGYAFSRCYSLSRVEAPLLEIVYGFDTSSGILTTVSFANCITLSNFAFQSNAHLSDVYLPKCETISSSAFDGCTALSTIDLPRCKVIGSSAFGSCTSLTSISIPACSWIGSFAFAGCTTMSMISTPVVTSVYAQAFQNTNISVFDFPELIDLGGAYIRSTIDGTFANNSCITAFSAAKLEAIRGYAFDGCVNLSDLSIPAVADIEECAFRGCVQLSHITSPRLSVVYSSAFYGTGLSEADMPRCSYIGFYAFAECSGLSWASFGLSLNEYLPSLWNGGLSSYAFQNCSNLTAVTLLGRFWSLPSPDFSSPFIGTPIGSGSGVIYVDMDYYDQYMSSSMWSWARSFIRAIAA